MRDILMYSSVLYIRCVRRFLSRLAISRRDTERLGLPLMSDTVIARTACQGSVPNIADNAEREETS